jgi:two-component system KDP operon response regulator KdpE
VSKVLVVDDEPAILTVVQRVLLAEGFSVLTAESGEQAVDLAVAGLPDLVILDLLLPDMEGTELIRALRRWLQCPILVLSAVTDEAHKVHALDAGADDYLEKPFGLAELRARARALLRRTTENSTSVVAFEAIRVDLAAGSLFVADREVRLTRTEWLLLQALVTNPGKLLTHRQVTAEVWGDGYGEEMRQTLRGHVKSLRAKLGDSASEPRYLRTESGAGYRWIAATTAPGVAAAGHGLAAPDSAAALHELDEALTLLTFSVDSALGIARGMRPGPAQAELLAKLERGLVAAELAQRLTKDGRVAPAAQPPPGRGSTRRSHSA